MYTEWLGLNGVGYVLVSRRKIVNIASMKRPISALSGMSMYAFLGVVSVPVGPNKPIDKNSTVNHSCTHQDAKGGNPNKGCYVYLDL